VNLDTTQLLAAAVLVMVALTWMLSKFLPRAVHAGD
jgi:hypothetical protein